MIENGRWTTLVLRCPYCAYFFVGSVIGVAAILLRELIGRLLGVESPSIYAATVAIVNALGVLTAFFAHRRFTFVNPHGESPVRGSLIKFVLIALFGIAISSAVSVALRYGLRMDDWLGVFAASVAFAVAVILASFVTYSLNARWNFNERA